MTPITPAIIDASTEQVVAIIPAQPGGGGHAVRIDLSPVLSGIDYRVRLRTTAGDGTTADTPMELLTGAGSAMRIERSADLLAGESLSLVVEGSGSDTAIEVSGEWRDAAPATGPASVLSETHQTRIADNGDGTKWLQFYAPGDNPDTDDWVHRVKYDAQGQHLAVESPAS